LNDWASAGDAVLIATNAAMRASFDLLILEILLVAQPIAASRRIAVGRGNGPGAADS
jgi:hypothetical protein